MIKSVYGTVSVNNSLVASHTPATADANHTFSLINGMLNVEIPNSAGNGTDYELTDGILSVNPGFTGSITAEYEFTTSPTREIDFKYDHNGLRTQKKVVENGVDTIYDYILHGKLITHLTKRTADVNGTESTEELHFFYDSQSKPTMVKYNGAPYRYIHNLQGDIVGLLDGNGNLVVEYKYDTWGKLLSITGTLKTTLGEFNPFRYRRYLYDAEMELYYLQNRYYNPLRGRFINVDAVLGRIGALGAHNLFAYCGNNPANYGDPNGNSAVVAASLGVVTGAAIGVLIIGGSYYLASKCLPYITLPKISITASVASRSTSITRSNATTAAGLSSDISSTAPVRADQLENDSDHDYFIAFCKKPNENSYLYVFPVALDIGQAVTMVKAETLMNDLVHSVGSTGAYGIYTPTREGAMALEPLIGGFQTGQKLNHGNKVDAKPGQYYDHFHDLGHNYHIWYGVPMNVGIG